MALGVQFDRYYWLAKRYLSQHEHSPTTMASNNNVSSTAAMDGAGTSNSNITTTTTTNCPVSKNTFMELLVENWRYEFSASANFHLILILFDVRKDHKCPFPKICKRQRYLCKVWRDYFNFREENEFPNMHYLAYNCRLNYDETRLKMLPSCKSTKHIFKLFNSLSYRTLRALLPRHQHRYGVRAMKYFFERTANYSISIQEEYKNCLEFFQTLEPNYKYQTFVNFFEELVKQDDRSVKSHDWIFKSKQMISIMPQNIPKSVIEKFHTFSLSRSYHYKIWKDFQPNDVERLEERYQYEYMDDEVDQAAPFNICSYFKPEITAAANFYILNNCFENSDVESHCDICEKRAKAIRDWLQYYLRGDDTNCPDISKLIDILEGEVDYDIFLKPLCPKVRTLLQYYRHKLKYDEMVQILEDKFHRYYHVRQFLQAAEQPIWNAAKNFQQLHTWFEANVKCEIFNNFFYELKRLAIGCKERLDLVDYLIKIEDTNIIPFSIPDSLLEKYLALAY